MKKKIVPVLKMTAYYSLLGLFLQGLIVNVLLAISPVGGQNLNDVKINVAAVTVTLEQALKIIEEKSNFRFSYSKDEIPVDQTVTLKAESSSLYDLLSDLSKEVGLVFNRINEQIVVKKADNGSVNSINQLSDAVKFKGKVRDKNGEPLFGASVILTAFKIGVATDIDGNFVIEVPKDLVYGTTVEMTVSYINYKKKTVRISVSSNEITQNFELDEDVFQNEEIVVTGIASKTSKSVAEVAVARVAASDLTAKQNYQNLSQLVSGKISGVNIQTSSGNIGSGVRFMVRGGGGLNGGGQPLIYIDGVRMMNDEANGYGVGGQRYNFLSSINVNDIENIEVLKGPAAAAMYGTNASNGVVLITTKSGKLSSGPGKSMRIDYKYNYGINSQLFKYDKENLLSGKTVDALLKPDGYIREHLLNITGGTGLLRFFMSYQKRFESGLIPQQNNENKDAFKLNTNVFVSDELNVQATGSFTSTKVFRPENDNNTWGWLWNTLINAPYSYLDSAAIATRTDENKTSHFVGGFKAIWKPLANFEINAGAGLDYIFYRQEQLYPYGLNYGGNYRGYKNDYSSEQKQVTYDFNARYSFNNLVLDGLNFTSIVGSQIIERKTDAHWVDVQFFNNPAITILGSAEEVTGRGDGKTNTKSAGIYWSNEFSYQDTYFWTLGIRRDFASAIGFEAPAITYPKASVAVRLDKYGFLPSQFNLFKFRVAYGETGQLPNQDDGIALTWTSNYGASGSGANVQSVGNIKIEPERIQELEVGFDTEFLGMFSLEFTYYNDWAKGSIVNATFAPSTGLGGYNYPYNVGSVASHGFETLLQINPIRSADYGLNLNLIWNYQKNEVQSLGEQEEILPSWVNIIKPGLPKYQFFDKIGVSPTYNATTQKYSGAILTSEKVDLGSPFPDHSGSITLNFRFLKNFNLYTLAEWGMNNKVFSYNLRRMARYDLYKPVLTLRAQLGLTTKAPEITRLTPGSAEYKAVAEKYAKVDPNTWGNYIFDAGYFIIRELSLSYDFTDLLKELAINNVMSQLTVGFSVRNLYKYTQYELDSEVNLYGGTSGYVANDFATLPQPRTFNFWINVGF